MVIGGKPSIFDLRSSNGKAYSTLGEVDNEQLASKWGTEFPAKDI
jgi:hypothetical protein